jgi:MFS family permease
MTKTKHDAYSALRFLPFRFFVLARMTLTLGVQMQAVIVGWQIYQLTQNPLALGLIGLTEAIPALSISLFAGHFADHYNRKRIIQFSQTVILIAYLSLAVLSLPQFSGLLKMHIWLIYFFVFISGMVRGLFGPATSAFQGQLIPKKDYGNSVTWVSTIWQLSAMTGPALAGFIYAFTSASFTYAVAAVLVFSSIIFMAGVHGKPFKVKKSTSLFDSLSHGLKFVFNNKIILSALSLDMFAVLFGGAVALLPIFAADILKTGAMGLGILRAAPALGAMTMAFALAHFPLNQKAGQKMLLAVMGFGICMIGFGLSQNFYLSLALLTVSGALDNISVVIRGTIVQTMTPHHMRGRVSSVNHIFIGSSNEIGAFESGLAASLMGLVPSVIFGGTMTLIVVAVTALVSPKLRKLDL